MIFRYYDPEIGRFLSEDPLGFEAGVNFYTYVNNNPINANDPMGLERQFNLGIGGTLFGTPPVFLPSGGISGDSYLGISLPDEISGLSDLADIQFFVQGRASGLVGGGLFAGVGVDVNVGKTDGPLPTGISTTHSFRIEGNVGWAAAAGFSVDVDANSGDLSAGNLTGLIASNVDLIDSGKFGAGYGLMLAGGVSQNVTAATPTIGEMYESAASYVSSFFSSMFSTSAEQPQAGGGFVIYPSKPNTNLLRSVYEK